MKKEISDLINITRFYGSNKDYVIAGGGNTSYKDDSWIWVKASGKAMGTIDEDGFAVLDRKKLEILSTREYDQDTQIREQQVKEDLAEATITKDRRPSVETSLHNLINHAFIVHLHPTIVNALMCSNGVGKYVNELFGDSVVYIPYTDPGYILFKKVKTEIEQYRDQKNQEPKIILLQNHGIFVGADSVEEIKFIYSDIIEKLLSQVKVGVPEEEITVDQKITELLPAFRMLIDPEGIKTLSISNNELIRHFSKSQEDYKKICKPFTPDIIVYCKSKYIYIDENEDTDHIINSFKKSVEQFESENGYKPKVVLLKGYGLIAIGDNSGQCEIITDVFTDLIKISWLSESFGGPHFMELEQIAFIDNWEVENYRRKVAQADKISGRLENKVIIVTGAAQGFGEGIARGLKQEGANIIVADLNQEKGIETAERFNSEMKGSNKAVFIQVDVSNAESVQNLIKETVCQFGGLDVFISNAGILKAGGLEEMTPEIFELVTKINYTGYFICAKYASAVMKIQNRINPGYFTDIIQINSKSGLSGSKKNFAYAGGKFGGIGLTQSFALELASDKIKVNSICPGNFYEGQLWSDPKNGLFVQYLNTGKVPGAKTLDDVKEHYMSQVPMGRGCSTDDVLKAVLYLIDQKYETGQALPVTGGQIMLK